MSKELKELKKLLRAKTKRLERIISDREDIEIAQEEYEEALLKADPNYVKDRDAYLGSCNPFYILGCDFGFIKNKYKRSLRD